jgi:hypothetical protein
MAYEGTLWIDPVSTDLVRLTATVVPPSDASSCQMTSSVDYERVRMGQRDVLVPRKTEVRMIDRWGGETIVLTSYTNCREFLGESAIRFDQPIEERQESQRHNQAASLPQGLVFESRIFAPPDWETAAAGDVIAASLRSTLTGTDGQVVARSGTRIMARLVRVFQSPAIYEICVRFESIEINGRMVPFGATQGPREAMLARRAAKEGPPLPPDAGVFVLPPNNLRIRYIDSVWITAPPKQ